MGLDGDPFAQRLAGLSQARRAEAHALNEVFRTVTGWVPRLWGKVIGYGAYEYTYASGRTGTCFATGFAPQKAKIALHIMPGYTPFDAIAARLGPHTRGASCWYITRVEDVDADALAELIRAGLDDLARQFPITAG